MSDMIDEVDEVEVADLAVEEGVEDVLLDHDGQETEADRAIAEPEAEIPRGDDAGPEAEGPSEEELEADMISIATEQAMQHLFDIQDRLEAAQDDHADKAEVAKTAKKRVESLQEDLSAATKRLREARTKSEPDPARYPLLDGRKEAVNAMFPKPEAIAPLPAEDFAEAYRRQSEKCELAWLGLKPATLKVLTDLGLRTVADYGRKATAIGEGGADLTSIKGMTERRVEEIADAIEAVAEVWEAEWRAANPEAAAAEDDADVEEAERRLSDPEQVPIPYEEAVAGIEAGDQS